MENTHNLQTLSFFILNPQKNFYIVHICFPFKTIKVWKKNQKMIIDESKVRNTRLIWLKVGFNIQSATKATCIHNPSLMEIKSPTFLYSPWKLISVRTFLSVFNVWIQTTCFSLLIQLNYDDSPYFKLFPTSSTIVKPMWLGFRTVVQFGQSED